METDKLHRGRLIDHIQIVSNNFPASKKFYTAIFAALDIPLGMNTDKELNADEFFLSTADSQAALGKVTGRTHLAFQAKTKELVEKVYDAAIKAGGKDNGKPGERSYHPGYYAGFFLDPDGNNIEVVYHGAFKESAPSRVITF